MPEETGQTNKSPPSLVHNETSQGGLLSGHCAPTGVWVLTNIVQNRVKFCRVFSGDSTSRPFPPTRGIKRPTRGTLKKNLVGETDMQSRLINIINLHIVLQPPTSH